MRRAVLRIFTMATALIWVCCLCVSAQVRTSRDHLRSVYLHYEYTPLEETPAPKGYKPVYISHYGRHGSRYPVNETYMDPCRVPLHKAKDAGILSPEGLRVLAILDEADSLSRGMYGQMSQLGIEEHQGIASRMARRYPEVFRKRDSIRCVTSLYPRCILSMSTELVEILREFPHLNVSQATGDGIYEWLCNDKKGLSGNNKAGRAVMDSLYAADFDFSRFKEFMFTDVHKADSLIPQMQMVVESMYANSASMPLFVPHLDLMSVFTDEEYALLYRFYNDRMFHQHCNSYAFGDVRIHYMDRLLEGYMDKADDALASGKVAADMRFGHDTTLMPFFSLIGLEGFDRRSDILHAHEVFNTSRDMTMATNLQMIFYRSKKGPVLVKFLLNEREVGLPLLEGATGPYYDWNAVRAYFKSRLAKQ